MTSAKAAGKGRPFMGGRVLFIDAYDSFTNNIVDLLETCLPVLVTVIRIDEKPPDDEPVHDYCRRFDAIVCGPGPGTPLDIQDVGIMKDVWTLDDVPILGICLGFQSLCHHFGATVERLPNPRHGLVLEFKHSGTDIFEGLPAFKVTSYHSLRVKLDHRLEQSPTFDEEPGRWNPSVACNQLLPLAWYGENGKPAETTLMAVRHVSNPFWGLQFHPESCMSDKPAQELIKKWWIAARTFNKDVRDIRVLREEPPAFDLNARLPLQPKPRHDVCHRMRSMCGTMATELAYREFDAHELTAETICEVVDVPESPSVVLDVKGRYSIISVLSPRSWTFLYRARTGELVLDRPVGPTCRHDAIVPLDRFWDTIQNFLLTMNLGTGNAETPFWGGLMGYFSYEIGTSQWEELNSFSNADDGEQAWDACLLWADRSIVLDREERKVYVQSIAAEDDNPGEWLDLITKRLKGFCCNSGLRNILLNQAVTCPRGIDHENNDYLLRLRYNDSRLADLMVRGAEVILPDKRHYLEKIRHCHRYIRSGESYELCLTDETRVILPRCKTSSENKLRHWILYKRLRKYNPAQYSAYFKLAGIKVISASPECFIRWDREQNYMMRPMKGTVKKTADMTLEKAKEILRTPKEQAENLMIADLVRHDMTGFCGTGGVEVDDLMLVEDHGRVYQLITSVNGKPNPRPPPIKQRESEFPVGDSDYNPMPLAHCLPPGSMTGAPKKRSCSILNTLERRNRGIYSGVMGYLDVGGGGSFSVIIRSACSSASDGDDDREVWRIGAGGAVTAMSDPEAEWNEMITKLDTIVSVFRSRKKPKSGDFRKEADSTISQTEAAPLSSHKPVLAQLGIDGRYNCTREGKYLFTQQKQALGI